MDKIQIDCTTKTIQTIQFTSDELLQRRLSQQQSEEKALLNVLVPSEAEVDKAEREIETINLLIDLGVNPMTTVQLRLISAYTTLVMAGRKTIDEVREDLQEAVRIRIAEIEIEKLSEV